MAEGYIANLIAHLGMYETMPDEAMEAGIVRGLVRQAKAALERLGTENDRIAEDLNSLQDECDESTRLLDHISHVIGIPHDEELSAVWFNEAWIRRAELRDRRIHELEERLFENEKRLCDATTRGIIAESKLKAATERSCQTCRLWGYFGCLNDDGVTCGQPVTGYPKWVPQAKKETDRA